MTDEWFDEQFQALARQLDAMPSMLPPPTEYARRLSEAFRAAAEREGWGRDPHRP